MTFTHRRSAPTSRYGVLEQSSAESAIDLAVESVRVLGYAVLDGGYDSAELATLSSAFDMVRARYLENHGLAALEAADEHNNVRLMLAEEHTFARLIFNARLIAAVSKLIAGKFVLNQQNGIVNPPGQSYNQGSWHRDLPYQHYVSSTPLAINALFCLDEFTKDNGGTFVLPASHKSTAFPSDDFVQCQAFQVEAKAGSFILLDCMTFHSGGFNASASPRRAVNHVFNIPYFKQQIRIPGNVAASRFSAHEQEVLGFDYLEPATVSEFLASRNV